MPLVSFDPFARDVLVVCDGCDGVLGADGTKLAKRHRESEPQDLAPHHHYRDVVTETASVSGWARDGERLSCPDCLRASKVPSP